jgi:hypothetical protein
VNAHKHIDEFKLHAALAILASAELSIIRQVSLANLQRWQQNGTWVSAFDEWRELMTRGNDADVIEAMSSRSERSNRLRQSAPYSGILDESVRIQLWRTHSAQIDYGTVWQDDDA